MAYGVPEAQSICGRDLEGEESVWIEESVKAIVLDQVSQRLSKACQGKHKPCRLIGLQIPLYKLAVTTDAPGLEIVGW